MATPAQILANRANALRSTGPRTADGKDASRRNALRHGLAAETLVLPEEEGDAVAARMLAWGPGLNPRDDYECRLVEEVALASVRVDRCRAREKALRNRQARRAATHWEADRAGRPRSSARPWRRRRPWSRCGSEGPSRGANG